MGGWWEQQCQDSSFQEVKSVFPEAVPHESSSSPPPASTEQRTAEPKKPVTFDGESMRGKGYKETPKKRHAVHYFICTVQRTIPSARNKLGSHEEAQGWLNVRRSAGKEKESGNGVR
ncbi:hypothetical protein PBY51_019319 [Eleginops maclovinus]|nr:hypothetical protein PBY51_019319 [Eleginops maclovinus]